VVRASAPSCPLIKLEGTVVRTTPSGGFSVRCDKVSDRLAKLVAQLLGMYRVR